MFKVVKKANVNEIKRVKLYYYFIIIANIISLISLVALNANHWGFFALGLFFISIPLVFLILENNNRANKKQIKILSTILMLVVLVGYELVQSYPATDRECYYTLIFIGLNLTLLTAHIFYWAIKDLTEFSNNFQMLNNKKCFKNRKVLRSLISVLLVTIIVAGGFHFGKLVTLKLSVDRALNSETFKYEFIQYSKYDKSNVNFTEEDETIIVNRGTFTYKIPQGMKDTTQEGGIYITHKNEAETILVASSYQPIKESYTSIFDYYEYELFSNETGEDVFDSSKPIFHSKMSKIMKDMLVEEYGFYPQNDYESRKIGGMLNLEDINYLDKQEAHAAAILAVFYAISSPAYDEAYFFETDELEGVVGIMEHTNEETGEKSCSYIFNFNKPNSEWLDCCVMVRLPEDVASTDLAYKIINSIEITEA